MSDLPVQLIVSAYSDEEAADAALKTLKSAKRDRLIGIESAAVLRKDDKGKLHIKETADMSGGKGATIGGVAGAVVGAIAGTALAAPLIVGGLIGGLAAKLSDSGFSDDRLKTFGAGLPAGSSAIVAVVEHTWVGDVQEALAETAADVVTEGLAADVAAQLEDHQSSSYSALVGDGSLVAGKIAVGDEEAEGSILAIDGEEIAGSSFLATDEGIVVTAGAVGPDGAVVGMAAEVADEGDGQQTAP